MLTVSLCSSHKGNSFSYCVKVFQHETANLGCCLGLCLNFLQANIIILDVPPINSWVPLQGLTTAKPAARFVLAALETITFLGLFIWMPTERKAFAEKTEVLILPFVSGTYSL